MTTGSLGHGLGAGVGMALGAKLDKKDYYIYVLLGDGELNEGIVWEAVECAFKYALDNLIVIVDVNGFQSCGSTEHIMPLMNIKSKWESFGWMTEEIDGHDFGEILSALERADKIPGKPQAIIAHTVKCKGVPSFEHKNLHFCPIPDDMYAEAMEVLKERG